jgi:putative spermidine/putrescine transport system ATP-binding protein
VINAQTEIRQDTRERQGLRILGLSKRYGSTQAVDEVSLEMRPGEFITLLGPSGSGKTTTLRIIAGFTTPDAGRVVLDGQDITSRPPERRNLGMVFQNYALFPHMSVFENVAFPLRMRRVRGGELKRSVMESLDKVHLSGLGGRNARHLSGGQQQRVALARALVFGPSVLLMDEPLSALDKRLREAMRLEIVRISREAGVTVLYVTHDQEEAFAMSDRIAIFRDGRIEQVGTARELYEEPISLFVAEFVGDSTTFRGVLDWKSGSPRVATRGHSVPVSVEACRRSALSDGDKTAVVIRPELLEVVQGSGSGSATPEAGHAVVGPGTVTEHLYLGASRRVVIQLSDGQHAFSTAPAGVEAPAWLAVGASVCVRWQTEQGVAVADSSEGGENDDEAVAVDSLATT